MAVTSDPNTAASAWVSSMQTASTKYAAGVQAVKVAPGQLAAAAADTWANNVAQSKPKFAKNSAAVSKESWQNSAVTKGAPRLASGATAAEPKMQAFMSKFIPQLSGIVNGLPQRGTFEQNVNRLTSFVTAVHATKGTF